MRPAQEDAGEAPQPPHAALAQDTPHQAADDGDTAPRSTASRTVSTTIVPEPAGRDATAGPRERPVADGGGRRHTGVSTAARLSGWVDARPAWLRWLAVLAVFGVLSVVLVGRFVPEKQALSRADEYVYIDAVDKATRGEVVRQGAEIDDYSLGLIACRGVELYGTMGDRCGGPYDRSTFPYRGGITSADIHSPVYYFVTAGGAMAIQALTPVDELLNAARLTGAIWLALGLTTLVGLARTLGAGRVASGAVGLLVLAAPSVRWTNVYVTPDALNLLAGSVIVLAAVNYARGRWSPWWLVAASAVAAAVKAQNSIASALAAVFLVVLAATVSQGRSWSRFWRHLGVGAAAVGAALAVQVGYLVLRSAWSLAPAPQMDTSAPLGYRAVLAQSYAFLVGVIAGPDATFEGFEVAPRPSTFAVLIGWLVAAAVIGGALFVLHLTDEQMRFAQATALSVLLAGPLFYLMMYATTGRAFDLPDRYGMVMLPAMAAVLAVLAGRRWVQVLMICLAALGYMEALTRLTMV